VRRIALNGKPPSSAGLAFGPDGSIYVTDMGRIIKYGSNGGNAVKPWAAISKGFNNVIGLAVDPDGMVYAAESGGQRVNQFDSNGNFIRAYDIRCEPKYAVVNGDWVDVTSQKG